MGSNLSTSCFFMGTYHMEFLRALSERTGLKNLTIVGQIQLNTGFFFSRKQLTYLRKLQAKRFLGFTFCSRHLKSKRQFVSTFHKAAQPGPAEGSSPSQRGPLMSITPFQFFCHSIPAARENRTPVSSGFSDQPKPDRNRVTED